MVTGHRALLIGALLVTFHLLNLKAQGIQRGERPSAVLSQYPNDGAVWVSPSAEIGIHAIGAFDPSTLANHNIIATGSRSGIHAGNFRLSRDNRTIIFTPNKAFQYGENVNVRVDAFLLNGQRLSYSFQFSISPHPIVPDIDMFAVRAAEKSSESPQDILPEMVVTKDDNPTRGPIYFANLGFTRPGNDCFLFVLNEHGKIMRQRVLPSDQALDFKIQPNGELTYYDANAGKFYGMDTSWNIVDSFQVVLGVEGIQPDGHDLYVFPDSGFALIGIEEQARDMSHLVDNGNSDATIKSNAVQVFDKDKNMILEFRGSEHYNVLDAIHEKLTAGVIDYEHANSIDFDSDRNILLSNRHLSEITQINGQTAEIMWRLGGAHNQFRFIGDSLEGTSYQHAARWLPNNHITIFDNGNYHTVEHTRAIEYALDTTAKTATLVWEYHHSPETYSSALGYVERLENGSTLIGWGYNADSLAITEVRPDKSSSFEMKMLGGNYSYRAIKYPSQTASVAANSSQTQKGLELDVAEISQTGNIALVYSVDHSQNIAITIYDALGRSLLEPFSGLASAGPHILSLNLSLFPSGTYYCNLRGEQGTATRMVTRTR